MAEIHGASRQDPSRNGGRPWSAAVTGEADALVASTLEVHPWLDRPEFHDSLRAWAMAHVRIKRVQSFLDDKGLLDAHGRPRPATKLLLTLEASAARARAALGFDPASFASIRKTVVEADSAQAALDDGLTQGRKIFARREAELAAAREADDLVEAGAELVLARRPDNDPPAIEAPKDQQ